MLSKPPTLPARFVLNYKVKHTLFALFSCAFLYACSGESSVSGQSSAVVIEGRENLGLIEEQVDDINFSLNPITFW